MAEKKCPECGSTFMCEGEKDCWCESAQIHKKELIVIMDRYHDCLCPDCLANFSEK
ncbi:MAG TPA: cysteine-rich CWC family protein [Bacteroidales bacterium]|nr:cysteine-rich CWC family protein [Bacteroidales bacterium]